MPLPRNNSDLIMASSSPAEEHSDIAADAAGTVDHFVFHLIAARLQLPFVESPELLGDAGQGLLPAILALVDGAAVVGAEVVGKAEDLHHGEPVADGALDDVRGLLHHLVVAQP